MQDVGTDVVSVVPSFTFRKHASELGGCFWLRLRYQSVISLTSTLWYVLTCRHLLVFGESHVLICLVLVSYIHTCAGASTTGITSMLVTLLLNFIMIIITVVVIYEMSVQILTDTTVDFWIFCASECNCYETSTVQCLERWSLSLRLRYLTRDCYSKFRITWRPTYTNETITVTNCKSLG